MNHNKRCLWRNMCWFWKKKPHNIGCSTFKL